jgi:hypothetical protein
MKRSLLLFGLFIPLFLLATSCGFGGTTIVIGVDGPAVAYHYWYYPAWGIYYDYGAHVYFYQDGPVWRRVVHLPRRYHGLGHYEVVESERGRPWARYEIHRAKYPPGHLRKEMREDDRNWDSDHGHQKHHFDDH